MKSINWRLYLALYVNVKKTEFTRKIFATQ